MWKWLKLITVLNEMKAPPITWYLDSICAMQVCTESELYSTFDVDVNKAMSLKDDLEIDL